MPGAAGGQRLLFEQQHVALAELGEVIRNRAADRAAADDDDPGGVGELAQARTAFRCGRGPPSAPRYQSTKCCTLVSRTVEYGPGS